MRLPGSEELQVPRPNKRTNAQTHKRANAHAHVHMCTRAHVHTCTRTHVHTCTRARVHTYTRFTFSEASEPARRWRSVRSERDPTRIESASGGQGRRAELGRRKEDLEAEDQRSQTDRQPRLRVGVAARVGRGPEGLQQLAEAPHLDLGARIGPWTRARRGFARPRPRISELPGQAFSGRGGVA